MKLAAERLESREVPAAFWWAPPSAGNLQATTANNWMMGPNTPYARWTTLPDWDDDLHFQSSNGGDYDCNIPLWATAGGEEGGPPAGSPDFAGIHVTDGYTKTVNLQRSPTVGTLAMAAPGNLAQNDPATAAQGSGGTLTVKTLLTWTGGGLNAGPLATLGGQVKLAATATGTAAPTNEGTVTLGSELILLGDVATQTGSTLTVNNGTYDLNLEGSFQATAASLLVMAPAPKALPRPGEPDIFIDKEKNTKPTVHIKEGAKGLVTSVGRNGSVEPREVTLSGGGQQFWNQGETTIESYMELILDQPDETKFAQYLQNAAGASPAGVVTKLEAGSKIIFKGKGDLNTGYMYLQQGQLELRSLPAVNGVVNDDQTESVIQSPANSTVPALYVNDGAKVTVAFFSGFVMLKLKGYLKCDGDIYLRADRFDGAKHDTIKADGQMTFQQVGPGNPAPSKLYLQWRNPGGALAGLNTKWLVLRAEQGIQVNPKLEWPSDTGVSFTFVTNDGNKEFGMERTA